MQTTPRGRLVFVALLTGGMLIAAGRARAAGGQDDKDAQYSAAIQQGDRAIELRQFDDALEAFKRASALRNRQSAEAHWGMARAYRGLAKLKNAAESCTDALRYVGTNTKLEADIRNSRGVAVTELVKKHDDKRLRDAEADFRAAVQLSDGLPIAHYNLGFVLLRQGRDDEGVEALNVFLAKAPDLREARDARRLIENPRRARMAFAPPFDITTLDGERIALEDLRGRVVLLDFWASWCGPCVAATPGLQRLAKKYAEAPFTLLGISLDRTEKAWTDYLAKNRMEWPQYLDNGRVASLFNVRPIPTYVIIDHEGVVRDVQVGYQAIGNGWLDRQIRTFLSEIPKPAGEIPRGGR